MRRLPGPLPRAEDPTESRRLPALPATDILTLPHVPHSRSGFFRMKGSPDLNWVGTSEMTRTEHVIFSAHQQWCYLCDAPHAYHADGQARNRQVGQRRQGTRPARVPSKLFVCRRTAVKQGSQADVVLRVQRATRVPPTPHD